MDAIFKEKPKSKKIDQPPRLKQVVASLPETAPSTLKHPHNVQASKKTPSLTTPAPIKHEGQSERSIAQKQQQEEHSEEEQLPTNPQVWDDIFHE